MDANPLDQLRSDLDALHLHAGRPSTRTIAARIRQSDPRAAISHSTAHSVLRCIALPRWDRLQAVIVALGGDVAAFRQQWVRAGEAPPDDRRYRPSVTLDRGDDGDRSRALGLGFSPDGHRLAIGTTAGLELWDLSTLQRLLLLARPRPVTSFAFSPTGDALATITDGQRMQLWDVESGRMRLPAFDGTLSDLAFHPDGSLLAGAGDDGLLLYDLVTGERTILAEREWRTQGDTHEVLCPVRSIAISPDGQQAASAHRHAAYLWDLDSGRKHKVPVEDHVDLFLYHPDGRLLFVRTESGAIGYLDTRTGDIAGVFQQDAGRANDLVVHPDGHLIATAETVLADPPPRRRRSSWWVDGPMVSRIRLWDVESTKPLGNPLISQEEQIVALAFHPDGEILTVAEESGEVRLWKSAEPGHPAGRAYRERISRLTAKVTKLRHERDDLRRHTGTAADPPFLVPGPVADADVTSLAFGPDSNRLLGITSDGTLRVWNLDGTEIATGPTVKTPLAIVCPPSGSRLLALASDGTLHAWDPSQGARTDVLPLRLSEPPYAGTFHPDGTLMAVVDRHGVGIWDLTTGNRGCAFGWHGRRAPLFAPESNALLMMNGSDLHIGDLATGQDRRLDSFWHESHVPALAAQPRGHLVAVAEFQGQGEETTLDEDQGDLHLWNLTTGAKATESFRFGGQGWRVAMTFNPAGRVLFATCTGRIWCWDVQAAGQISGPVMAHAADITALAVSPNGESLATAGRDGRLRLWSCLDAE